MTITPQSSPEMTLQDMDMQARIDPTRAETSFVKGRNLFLKREDAPYRSLVSLDSSIYQGMMYRVSFRLSGLCLAVRAPDPLLPTFACFHEPVTIMFMRCLYVCVYAPCLEPLQASIACLQSSPYIAPCPCSPL